jgi:RNA polymerase sigma factor (sigma-70 family)
VEASAFPASAALARPRISIGVSLLRLRTDEQLVSLFRSGNDDAFRVIHDRYRQRLFVYARQMLGGACDDAEDALQEIFVRAYAALRANDRELALRAWLYRIAHNRCIDQLRRPPRPMFEDIELVRSPAQDPAVKAEQRDTLRRLVTDVQRLPEQQRSALLMRELGGMAYADLAGVLDVSVPAVKSLLVRARVGLAQAEEARDMACASIREDVILSHDRGVRLSGVARRHMRDCAGCRAFRTEVRGVSHQFAALAPTLGPLGLLANFLGIGGGGGAAAGAGGGAAAGAGGGAAAGGGALAAGGSVAVGSGAIASAGALATGAGHIVTLLAAAVVTAGGAVEVQSTLAPPPMHRAYHHGVSRSEAPSYAQSAPVAAEAPALPRATPSQSTRDPVSAPPRAKPKARAHPAVPKPAALQAPSVPTPGDTPADGSVSGTVPTSDGTTVPLAPADGTLSPAGLSSTTSSTGMSSTTGSQTSTSAGTSPADGTSSSPTASSAGDGTPTSAPSAASSTPQPVSGSGDPSAEQHSSPNSTPTG